MIRLDNEYPGRITPADANYPDGSIKNETIPNSSDDGTPLDELWGNDIEGFKQAVVAEANITPNDTPETVLVSQWLDGLKKILKNSIRSITATVAANALTLGLKADALHFRNSVITSGISDSLDFSDLSLVVPSGATLGTVGARQSRLILLAINNAGTVELAVVNLTGGNNLDETTLITTVAIDAAADSNNVIYSEIARANVPFRVVGFIESTQAVAGTWATAPSTIQGEGGNALTAMSSIGYGQAWQDVIGSRSSGTTYYNTTGKPIMISAYSNSIAGNAQTFDIAVGGVTIGREYVAFSSQDIRQTVTAIIPHGASYVLTATNTSIAGWSELR